MGELIEAGLSVRKEDMEPLFVETPGGRIQIRWDHEASATPHAQSVFFAEFLSTTGVYDSWVNSCPLRYESGNAPGKRDVPGSCLLSVLSGYNRYAHITALRGNGVSTSGRIDQGWSAVEDTLRLAGWDRERRVIILRRKAKTNLALSRKTKDEQIELLQLDKSGIRVASYLTELPPKKLLEQKLHESARRARAELEGQSPEV